MSIFSFSSATYQYDEKIGGAVIIITRSGNIETPAIVLVASNNVQITSKSSCMHNFLILLKFLATACNGSLPASPVLEFQPGETEKQITVTFSDITRIELHLSAGEGVYLTPFPRTGIIVDGTDLIMSYFLHDLCESIHAH